MANANNLIVIKTLSASAAPACEAIDSLKWPEIVGTLAGENTVLVIVQSTEQVEEVMNRLRAMIK